MVRNTVEEEEAGVLLQNLGKALVWWAAMDQVVKLLPPITKDLQYVQILKDSFDNKTDLAWQL